MLKKRSLIFLFALLAYAPHCLAQDVPQPVGWVNDFANVISQEYRDKLSSLIGELEEKTSSEIAVVTVTSIAPYDENAYARMLFDSWKPGKKGKDNGVLILLAIKERRWRIETGYGVEGILPDGRCGEIGRNYMVPYFKNGDYGAGLYHGATALADVIAKGAGVQLAGASNIGYARRFREISSSDIKLFIFAVIFILLQHWALVLLGAFFLFVISGFRPWAFILITFLLLLRLLIWKGYTVKGGNVNYWSGGFGGGGFGGGGGAGGGF